MGEGKKGSFVQSACFSTIWNKILLLTEVGAKIFFFTRWPRTLELIWFSEIFAGDCMEWVRGTGCDSGRLQEQHIERPKSANWIGYKHIFISKPKMDKIEQLWANFMWLSALFHNFYARHQSKLLTRVICLILQSNAWVNMAKANECPHSGFVLVPSTVCFIPSTLQPPTNYFRNNAAFIKNV